MAGPLHGIRIIDLSTALSGPVATTLLADQGADVIKLEAPGMGDITRVVGSHRNGMRAMYHLSNRGKRAIVLDLGLDSQYPQLAHHNFFFSGDQREHFRTVFRKHELPPDPTLYVAVATKSDPTVAPAGCDSLKILPHIPYIDDDHPLTRDDYMAFKERVVDKLERMGLTDLRKHVVFEHVWTPLDIREQYNSTKGSIYGVACDRFKNLGFKAPKQSTKYSNLFFVGGSVNPGGGMPMVVLCGQNVCRKIVAWDQAQPS